MLPVPSTTSTILVYPQRPFWEKVQRFIYQKEVLSPKRDLRLFLLYATRHTDFSSTEEVRKGSLVGYFEILRGTKKIVDFSIPNGKESDYIRLFAQHLIKEKTNALKKISKLNEKLLEKQEEDGGEEKESVLEKMLKDAYQTQMRTLTRTPIKGIVKEVQNKVSQLYSKFDTGSAAYYKMEIEENSIRLEALNQLLAFTLEYAELKHYPQKDNPYQILERDVIESNAVQVSKEDLVIQDLTSIIENQEFSKEKRLEATRMLEKYQRQQDEKKNREKNQDFDEKADIVLQNIQKHYLDKD